MQDDPFEFESDEEYGSQPSSQGKRRRSGPKKPKTTREVAPSPTKSKKSPSKSPKGKSPRSKATKTLPTEEEEPVEDGTFAAVSADTVLPSIACRHGL